MGTVESRGTEPGLSTIEEQLVAQGGTLEDVTRRLMSQRIETPSWGYANSGTRFKVFPQPGVPRSVEEKLADAAQVHRLTGVAPSVALHIPWDRVDDYSRHVLALGIYQLSVSDIERRVSDTTDPIGTLGATDAAYALSYAYSVSRSLGVGVTGKYITQSLDSYHGRARVCIRPRAGVRHVGRSA